MGERNCAPDDSFARTCSPTIILSHLVTRDRPYNRDLRLVLLVQQTASPCPLAAAHCWRGKPKKRPDLALVAMSTSTTDPRIPLSRPISIRPRCPPAAEKDGAEQSHSHEVEPHGRELQQSPGAAWTTAEQALVLHRSLHERVAAPSPLSDPVRYSLSASFSGSTAPAGDWRGLARPVVSHLLAHSTSPRSPLSGLPRIAASGPDDSSAATTRALVRRRSSPRTTTGWIEPDGNSPTSSSRSTHSVTLAAITPRRKSGLGFSGSYENSLINGRMSILSSASFAFRCAVGVLGAGGDCPPHLKNIPLAAFFYDEGAGEDQASPQGSPNPRETAHGGRRPYVGTIDLESFFIAQLDAATAGSGSIAAVPALPKFPGYQIPAIGQLQLSIQHAPGGTSAGSMSKLFLIPYDITGLHRSGQGGRTFQRQKSYLAPDDGQTKETLRDAVHLQFCSPPQSSASSASPSSPSYYLHGTIRVVFGSSAYQKLRIVNEGPAEFGPYKGSSTFSMARKKARARQRVASALGPDTLGLSQLSLTAVPALAPVKKPPLVTTRSGLSTTRPAHGNTPLCSTTPSESEQRGPAERAGR